MQQDWVTLGEAAERLGVSVKTARRWARDGKLRAEPHQGAHGVEYRVRADDLAQFPAAAAPIPDAAELAVALEALRAEVREATVAQAAREGALRAELETTRDELAAAHEALRHSRGEIAALHHQVEERDELLAGKTQALLATHRQTAARESGRLNVLRETLQEGQRPWWRRLKGRE